ncbi:MAG TPA: S8 family serine peptidase [Vicinamibacterales bacterium]
MASNSGLADLPTPGGHVLVAIVGDGFDKLTVTEAGSMFDSNFGMVASHAKGTPGDAEGGNWHGEMCAYDVSIGARNASITDIRISTAADGALSDALEAYGFLLNKLTEPGSALKQKYQALVVSNSWTASDNDSSLPPGTVPYFSDPTHPFTLAVKELVREGADVVFSAGNRGCSAAPGTVVIGGANSLPEVITVAAIDAGKSVLPISSQGPGKFVQDKPDVSSYGNFIGSDDRVADTGTSAAAAVTAGIIAAMRSQSGWAAWGPTSKKPADLKTALTSNADKQVFRGGAQVVLTGWAPDFGFGIARFHE